MFVYPGTYLGVSREKKRDGATMVVSSTSLLSVASLEHSQRECRPEMV